MQYVTYGELIQVGLFVLALIGLVYKISHKDKKITALSLEHVSDEVSAETKAEKRLLAYYKKLDEVGRKKVDAYMEDISRIYSKNE